jgi:hypothetical protein
MKSKRKQKELAHTKFNKEINNVNNVEKDKKRNVMLEINSIKKEQLGCKSNCK